MWAYLCGVVASGSDPTGRWWLVLLGVFLAGPVVCGMSQAANDWCDRHVDAINEPRAYMVGKRLIDAGKSADRAAVADPGVALKSLLAG